MSINIIWNPMYFMYIKHRKNKSIGFSSLPEKSMAWKVENSCVRAYFCSYMGQPLFERGGLTSHTGSNLDLLVCFFRPCLSSFISYHIPLYCVLWPCAAASDSPNRLLFYFKPRYFFVGMSFLPTFLLIKCCFNLYLLCSPSCLLSNNFACTCVIMSLFIAFISICA